jgi:hypothetical protein
LCRSPTTHVPHPFLRHFSLYHPSFSLDLPLFLP